MQLVVLSLEVKQAQDLWMRPFFIATMIKSHNTKKEYLILQENRRREVPIV